MLEQISLGAWGTAFCEPGAFKCVKNEGELAKRIAQRKWALGEPHLITRADVEGFRD